MTKEEIYKLGEIVVNGLNRDFHYRIMKYDMISNDPDKVIRFLDNMNANIEHITHLIIEYKASKDQE